MSCRHHQQTLHAWDPHTDLPEETALHMDGCADCRAAFDHRFAPAVLPTVDPSPMSPPETLMPASTTSILPIAAFAAAAAAAVYGTVIHEPTQPAVAPPPITEAAPPDITKTEAPKAVHTNHQPPVTEPTPTVIKATPPSAEDLIGQPAPALDSAVWFLGQGSLDDGKVTLLIFWDSTCLYCDDAMHKVEAWNQELGDSGLNVLGLTSLKGSSMGEAYDYLEDMGEDGVSFPNAHDVDREISDAYEVKGIPAVALVSEGEVLWRGHPSKLDPDYLRELLD